MEERLRQEAVRSCEEGVPEAETALQPRSATTCRISDKEGAIRGAEPQSAMGRYHT